MLALVNDLTSGGKLIFSIWILNLKNMLDFGLLKRSAPGGQIRSYVAEARLVIKRRDARLCVNHFNFFPVMLLFYVFIIHFHTV